MSCKSQHSCTSQITKERTNLQPPQDITVTGQANDGIKVYTAASQEILKWFSNAKFLPRFQTNLAQSFEKGIKSLVT